MGISWFNAVQNSPSFVELTFYYSKFSGSEIPSSAESRLIDNKIDDYTFKNDFTHVFSNRNEFYGGVKVSYLKNNLNLSNSSGNVKNVGSEGTLVNAYSGFKILSVVGLKIDFGSRFNLKSLMKETPLFYEPRINATYSLLPTLNIKAAWGIYQQELVTISDEDEVLALFEPWMITPNYLKPSNSTHYIGGVDYYMTERLRFNGEVYYKVMHNLAVINDAVIYPTDQQLINGSGKSYGAEVTANYKNTWVNAQISYSYSWTTKKVKDIEYHPRYDSRNAVKMFFNFELGKNWRAGVSWNYSSGLPFTQIFGYYSKFNPVSMDISSLLTNYRFYPIQADRNAAHLPDYHRLDINLSKKFRLWFMNLNLDLSLMNIYDRKNFFYFDLKTGERVNMLPFIPSIDLKVDL